MKKDEYGLVEIESTDHRMDIWKQFNDNNQAILFHLKRIDETLEHLKKKIEDGNSGSQNKHPIE